MMSSEQDGAMTFDVESPQVSATEQVLRVPSLMRCGVMILFAKLLLRFRGFGPTLRWIQERVTTVPLAAGVNEDAVLASERMVALACALYPGRAQCLERSMVLYYLLRKQGVDVQFMKGIKVDPFAAHAWIEYRKRPINDVAEHVELYTPLPE